MRWTILLVAAVVFAPALSEACSPDLDYNSRRQRSSTSFEGRVVETQVTEPGSRRLRAKVHVTRVIKGAVPGTIFVRGPAVNDGGLPGGCFGGKPGELEELKAAGSILEFNLADDLGSEPEVRFWSNMIWAKQPADKESANRVSDFVH
jgi:hypothetical protein